MLISTLFLVLVAVQWTPSRADHFVKVDGYTNKLPEYPGLQVYRQLDDLLREKINNNSLEANTGYLKRVLYISEQGPVRSKELNDAINLILVLKFVVDEQRCDNLASGAVWLNFEAVNEAMEEKLLRDDDDLQIPRIDSLFRQCFEKIVATCAPLAEENLEREIESIQDDGYRNLTAYLSEHFISQWSERANFVPGIGIRWKKMNPELDWSKGPFNQHELMLQQLFLQLDRHPQPLDGQELYYLTKNGERWPKIVDQQVLMDLIDARIVRPCRSYRDQVEANVFELMYQAANYNGQELTDKYLETRSHRFLANLFRYEFCHLDAFVVGGELWQFYLEATSALEEVV